MHFVEKSCLQRPFFMVECSCKETPHHYAKQLPDSRRNRNPDIGHRQWQLGLRMRAQPRES